MIPFPLQLKSLEDLRSFTWDDILYGYSHKFVGWRTVVELATERAQGGSSNRLEVELAAVGKDHVWKVGELLRQLAAAEAVKNEIGTEKKWLFLILKWLYENQHSFADPLGEVEELYADFGYPAEISHFVRFLPAGSGYRPQEHTQEENIQRLFDLWSEYLRTAAVGFR